MIPHVYAFRLGVTEEATKLARRAQGSKKSVEDAKYRQLLGAVLLWRGEGYKREFQKTT